MLKLGVRPIMWLVSRGSYDPFGFTDVYGVHFNIQSVVNKHIMYPISSYTVLNHGEKVYIVSK